MAQQQMADVIGLYAAAAKGFRQTLAGVRPNQMSNATPCTLWNVQALINHNIKVLPFVQGVFMGNINDDSENVSGPLPPEGALAALDAGVAKVLGLIKTSGALAKELNTPFGATTGAQFLMNPIFDFLVHTWDLAKATGQDTRLDGRLVEVCYADLLPRAEALRAMKIFGPAVAVPKNANLQDKLIGMLGRKP